MSGRHRKPTNSSIGIAKIALTGAVLSGSGIGLAAQAQAATDAEWDTVANCESSGNWSINTGNGYHGGLQFAPSTWLGYGGGEFASSAHLATRDQQIAIAEKVLAGQGKGAWPTCGRGLSGPTPRNVSADSAAADEAVKADAAIETEAAAESLDADATAEAEAAVTPLDAPADAPMPAAPVDGPLPEAPPAPQDAPMPEPEIIAIAESTVAPDEIVPADAPEVAPGPTILQASLPGSGPLAPADPAGPSPAPAEAPGEPVAEAPGSDTTAVASDELAGGVPHLPSPDSLPPGTSAEPVGPVSNPNVAYIKDLWQALKNDQIDRDDLIVALAQRSFTSPIPGEAPVDPALTGDPVLTGDPAPAIDAAPAGEPAPADPAPAG